MIFINNNLTIVHTMDNKNKMNFKVLNLKAK